MSIRVGNREDLGGIKYLGPRESSDQNITSVFWRDRLIWPAYSKYLFYLSEGSFYDPNKYSIYIKCNPAQQTKTIYLRSCTRFFKKKYNCYVSCASTWVKVNGQELGISNDVNVSMSREECEDKSPDGTFTISVDANPTNISRTAVFTVFQVDDEKSNAPTGKSMQIYLVQEADYPDDSKLNYNNMGVTWYRDSKYLKTTESYGTKASPIIGANGGTFQVYFSLYMNVKMMSGYYSRSYYGQSKGQDTSKVKLKIGRTEYSTSCIGNGMFSATIEVSNQISSESTVVPEIVNLIVSNNGDVDYNGGYLAVSWQTYATISSLTYSFSLGVYVPERNGVVVGEIPCWQGGGTYYKKVTNVSTGLTIPSEYSSFIHKYQELSMSNDGTFTQRIKVDACPEVNAWVVENMTCYQPHEDPTTGFITDFDENGLSADYTDDVQIEFDIVEKNGSCLERRGNVIVYADATKSVTKTTSISQSGKEGVGSKKVTWIDPTDLKNFTISEVPTIEKNFIFKSFTSPTYVNYKWKVIGRPRTNDPIKSDYEIEVMQHDEILASDAGTTRITWTVKSGTTNSKKRESVLKFLYLSKNMSSMYGVVQNGSDVEEGYKYHKDLCRNLGGGQTIVQNLTDGTTVDTNNVSIQGVIYYANVTYKKNTSKDDTSVAYVKPTEIKSWSVGDVDNLCNSAFYVSIYGKNVYKGKERTVQFKITLSNLKDNPSKSVSKTFNSAQKGSTTVIDESSSAPCIGIDEDSFSLTKDSEGKISEGFSLISESAGIYKIPVHINDNTSPTERELTVNYDYVSHHNAMNLTVPNFYDTLSVPFSASWTQKGRPVDRRVSLVIDMMDNDNVTLDGLWKNILYTGDLSTHTIYGTDWKAVIPKGVSWISPSSTVMTFSSNDTGSRRNATVTVEFYDNSDSIGSLDMRFTQEVTTRDANFTFSTSIDESTWQEVTKDGLEFNLYSFDNYDSKEVTVKDTYDKTKISLSKKTVENATKYVITPLSSNTSTEPIKTTLTIDQYDRIGQKKVATKTISMYIPGYEFGVSPSKTTVDPSDPTCVVSVKSSKSIVENGATKKEDIPYYFSQSDYNIGIMSDKYFTCTSTNRTGSITTTTVTCTQAITGNRKMFSISERWWSENDLDTSSVDLLTLSDSISREFSSSTSDGKIKPKVEYYTGSMNPSDLPIKATITENYDDKYIVTFQLTKEQNGDIPDYGLYRVCNDKWEIGRMYVRRHAWWLDATTENSNRYVWYVSSHAGYLWSLYYVNSRYDGEFSDYDITILSGDYTLYKENTAVTVRPNTTNTSSSHIVGYLKVVQKVSGKSINIRIEQITKSEDYDVDI